MKFEKRSRIGASAGIVFEFHERPDAFELLQPPWQKFDLIQPPSSLEVGTRVILKVKVGPVWQSIEAEHVMYEPGKMFADRMVKGPFAYWFHKHIVIPGDENHCELLDDVEYRLPFGGLGRALGGRIARRQLEKLFAYRHEVTRRVCEAAATV